MKSSNRRYQVWNADSVVVAEYDAPEHAIESAEENAAAGLAELLDEYMAWDTASETALALFKSTDDGAVAQSLEEQS